MFVHIAANPNIGTDVPCLLSIACPYHFPIMINCYNSIHANMYNFIFIIFIIFKMSLNTK